MKRHKEKIITIDRTAITRDEAMQSRICVDQSTIDQYVEDFRNGAVFPPMNVVKDGKTYWLVEGWHRMGMYDHERVTKVKVCVVEGDRDLATELSAGSNAVHGKPRTYQDKQRSVLILLEIAKRKKWSTEQIAQKAKVSFHLADKLRREHSEDGGERVGRNGQVYQSKPAAALSRESAQSDPEPVVDTSPEELEKLGNATPPVKLPKGRIEDCYDKPVPERLSAVFMHGRELTAIALDLAKTKTRLLAALRHESGGAKRVSLAACEKNIEETIRMIRSGKPDALCPECLGVAGSEEADVCKTCDGEGWLHEARTVTLMSRHRKIVQECMRKGA